MNNASNTKHTRNNEKQHWDWHTKYYAFQWEKKTFWLSICYTLEFVQHYYLSSKVYGSIGPTTKYVQTILEGIAFGNSKLNNRFDATILIRRAQLLSYTHCSDILSACFIFQDLIINLELNQSFGIDKVHKMRKMSCVILQNICLAFLVLNTINEH